MSPFRSKSSEPTSSMLIAAVHRPRLLVQSEWYLQTTTSLTAFPVPIDLNLPTANCTPVRMIFFKSIRSLPLYFIRTVHPVNSPCSLAKQYEPITESGAMLLKSGAMACSGIAYGIAWINGSSTPRRSGYLSTITVCREWPFVLFEMRTK